MSSSYSSLDWVFLHTRPISLCVDLFVLVCICVFFCFILHSSCIIVSTVGWTWWDWSLILWTYLPSVLWHCWLGQLTRKNPSPIWRNVFGGTLSLTQSINHLFISISEQHWHIVHHISCRLQVIAQYWSHFRFRVRVPLFNELFLSNWDNHHIIYWRKLDLHSYRR